MCTHLKVFGDGLQGVRSADRDTTQISASLLDTNASYPIGLNAARNQVNTSRLSYNAAARSTGDGTRAKPSTSTHILVEGQGSIFGGPSPNGMVRVGTGGVIFGTPGASVAVGVTGTSVTPLFNVFGSTSDASGDGAPVVTSTLTLIGPVDNGSESGDTPVVTVTITLIGPVNGGGGDGGAGGGDGASVAPLDDMEVK